MFFLIKRHYLESTGQDLVKDHQISLERHRRLSVPPVMHPSTTAAAAGCQSQRGGLSSGRDGELHRDAAAAGCCRRYSEAAGCSPALRLHTCTCCNTWLSTTDQLAEKNHPLIYLFLFFLHTGFNEQVTLNWWACCWSEGPTPWWAPCTVMASPLRRRETWTPTAWQQLMDTGD